MIKAKEKRLYPENLIRDFSKSLGLSFRFSELLISRGIDTLEKAKTFLSPKTANLSDPYLLKGIKESVERIKRAKDNGETVVVYGDYDADGITATTILSKCLLEYGIRKVIPVIPEREDGYGLSIDVLERFLDEDDNPELLITVDCGISAVKEVMELQDLDIDVIITDHHEIPDEIPSTTVVNCKLDGELFDGLCGAGVAYKLCYALIGEKANKYLDLVAIATVADNMPILGENRIIVSHGLELMKSGRCQPSVNTLISSAGMKEFTTSGIGYALAPRINAAGRMGNAYSALELFLTDDERKRQELATKLQEYNVKRQISCDELYQDAKSRLKDKVRKRVIVLFGEKWKTGLLGIVAAKLCEEYFKPVILFTERDGVLHGSARSIQSVNIFKAISEVKEYTVEFGGHSQAAGVSVEKDKLEKFENALDDYLKNNYVVSDFKKTTEVEEILTDKFSMEFAKEIELLEPCGAGNKKPLFAVNVGSVLANVTKAGSTHVLITTDYIDMIYFGGYQKLPLLLSPVSKTIVFESNVSTFNGREYLKGTVKEISTEYKDGDEEKATILGQNLNLLLNSKGDAKTIKKEDAQDIINRCISDVYGTLFVLYNPENHNKYKGLENFESSVYSPNLSGNVNCLCYGFSGQNANEYDKIVYLDSPLQIPQFKGESFVVDELDGFVNFDLSTDREIFKNIFIEIKKLGNSSFDTIRLKRCGNLDYSIFEIEFAIKVFFELGFIILKDGRYMLNPFMENKGLDKSIIYNEMLKKK